MNKALTVKNPWAWLIVQGIKDIENRTWRTNFRGRVLIHASANLTKGFYSEILPMSYWGNLNLDKKTDLIAEWTDTRGQILGSVEIIDCVQDHPSIWAQKGFSDNGKPIWNWVLANPQPEPFYEGIKIKGALSFWDVPIKP